MSLISFSATRSRAAAWLALMAVLLLFVAPVISKSLAQLHGDKSASGGGPAVISASQAATGHHPADTTADSMPAQRVSGSEHHASSAHQLSTAEHHASSAHQLSATEHHRLSGAAEHHAMMAMGMMMPFHHPMSMMDDSACGYCVLLLHLALTLTVLSLLWCLLQAAIPPAVPLIQVPVARFVPRFFHPRAPPVVH